MLSRPHTQAPASSAADRAQLAALSGTMGLFAGVVLFAALAFLYTLTQQVHDQTATLADLRKSVARTDQVQELALETLLAKGEDGSSPRKFVEGLTRARKDLEETREEAKSQKALALVAGAENRRLEKELGALKKSAARAEDDFKKAEADVKDQRAKVRELDEFFSTDKGELFRKYQFSWYAAIAGWGVAVIATLGLVAIWASRTPLGGEDPRDGGNIGGGMGGMGGVASPRQEPPHQIA